MRFDLKVFAGKVSYVLLFNIFTFLAGLITIFYIPKFISITDYAEWKEFGLYYAFAGLLNFGIVDGAYVRFGGKTYSEIRDHVLEYQAYLFLSSTIFSLLFGILLVVLFGRSSFFILLIANAFFFNIMGYYINIFNAIGRHVFANIIRLYSRMGFLILFLFIYWMYESLNLRQVYFSFTIINLTGTLFLMVWLYITAKGTFQLPRLTSKAMFALQKDGIPVLFANVVQIILFNIDLIFVKIIASPEEFAIYGFAVTVIKALLVLTNSFKLVLYPYLSVDNNLLDKHYLKLKTLVYISGVLLTGILLVVLKIIIFHFLPEYIPSLNILKYLLFSVPSLFSVIVFQYNTYLVGGNQARYLKNNIISIAIGTLLNMPGILLGRTEWIAMATVVSFALFSIQNEYSMKMDNIRKRIRQDIVYMMLLLLVLAIVNQIKIVP